MSIYQILLDSISCAVDRDTITEEQAEAAKKALENLKISVSLGYQENIVKDSKDIYTNG